MDTKELRERLAALAHDQWSGWMIYLFSKGTNNPDGTWTMPEWAVKRWSRQAGMKYEGLTEEERESDRKEADRVLTIIKPLSDRIEALEEAVREFVETADWVAHALDASDCPTWIDKDAVLADFYRACAKLSEWAREGSK